MTASTALLEDKAVHLHAPSASIWRRVVGIGSALVIAMLSPLVAGQTTPLVNGRDIGPGAPWLSYYGSGDDIDLARVAQTYRLIDIDADPSQGNFTPAQIATLKAGGRNRVISYLNLGSCERFRSYWQQAPAGFISCAANYRAHLGRYEGYANETWMNPANPDYRKLIVSYVAPRLVAQGIDGFYLDNLELIDHGVLTRNGPCDAACKQGVLDLVRELRQAFPDKILVMQNATGSSTRRGTTGGVAFASLLDGVAHEEVYAPEHDADAEGELRMWSRLPREANAHKLWIGTLDYVGSCENSRRARAVIGRSRARGFSPSVSDASAGQNVVCDWGPDTMLTAY